MKLFGKGGNGDHAQRQGAAPGLELTEAERLLIGSEECRSMPFKDIGDWLVSNGIGEERVDPLKGIIRKAKEDAQLGRGGAER
jgi:hypothetical protein